MPKRTGGILEGFWAAGTGEQWRKTGMNGDDRLGRSGHTSG